MEMLNVMYELTTTKSALEMAETTIRKQKGKLLRKNLLIAGLLWFGLTSCKMLDEVDKKLRDAETHVRETEAELAMMHHNYDLHGEEQKDAPAAPEKDTCCDGCATITKKDV